MNVRALKRLEAAAEAAIGMTVVSPDVLEDGWTFAAGPDPLSGCRHLHELYSAADPNSTGSVTVPVLWDGRSRRIVNNESSEIIRMLNRDFDAWGDAAVDLYPVRHAAAIDRLNGRIYGAINNGVCRAGFATTQAAYAAAVDPLFAELEALDTLLQERRS